RRRWTLQMASFAAAGCAVGAAVSFLLPVTYVSSAVMLRTPQVVPEHLLGAMAPAPMAEWLPQMKQQVLSRGSLSEIMQRPSLDLYKRERAQTPLENVLDTMRTHIRIDMVGAASFSIAYSYTDRHKAQAVVQQLVSKFATLDIAA